MASKMTEQQIKNAIHYRIEWWFKNLGRKEEKK
ncbi:hypothetical protein [PinkBerry-associated phage LS06-2018-MD08]|nr:hypothetical protein [PinkBerry-associated phage LS06-2018-MD08]